MISINFAGHWFDSTMSLNRQSPACESSDLPIEWARPPATCGTEYTCGTQWVRYATVNQCVAHNEYILTRWVPVWNTHWVHYATLSTCVAHTEYMCSTHWVHMHHTVSTLCHCEFMCDTQWIQFCVLSRRMKHNDQTMSHWLYIYIYIYKISGASDTPQAPSGGTVGRGGAT